MAMADFPIVPDSPANRTHAHKFSKTSKMISQISQNKKNVVSMSTIKNNVHPC